MESSSGGRCPFSGFLSADRRGTRALKAIENTNRCTVPLSSLASSHLIDGHVDLDEETDQGEPGRMGQVGVGRHLLK
jgi:hypothetical protein